MFSNIFLVLCVFRTGLHGAQPIKTFVSNWKTMFCSWAEEMRSLFLVRTRMCCCVVQAAANWPWFALSHLLLTNDWNFDTLIGMKRLGGGQVVQQMRAKDRTFETVRNLYGFCHIWWHVYGTFCIWGVPCPAVVCCCDDWEIDFNVCMLFLFDFLPIWN
jgi:hypothetical protein